MKISVTGLGYLGLTHAVSLVQLGHEVVGVENNVAKLNTLRSGRVPFFEPGLEIALIQAIKSEKITFLETHDKDVLDCQVHFICVGTPQKDTSYEVDTSQVFEATRSLLPFISPKSTVVGKSTVPVGTARNLYREMSKTAGFNVNFAWNPEFLREGTALKDALNPDRIVIGGDNPGAWEAVRMVYATQIRAGTPLVECDLETAELVKVAANAFLATKVSFINAMAEVAEVCGADAKVLANAIGYDERIGNKFLRTGVGFGGGCLPKDIRGFIARADELGAGQAVGFLRGVDAINQRRREKIVSLSKQELGELSGKKVLMLGLSFKPDSDDLRDSPALDIALRLAEAGAKVTVHDPVSLGRLGKSHEALIREEDLLLAAKDQELVILGTEWGDYKAIDPAEFGQKVRNKLIIDGRNVLDVPAWQAAGWRLIALGRNVHN